MTSLTQHVTVWLGKTGFGSARPRRGGPYVAARSAARPALSENRSYRVSVPSRKGNSQLWFFGLALLAVNSVLLVSYFFSINHFAAKGYEMKQLSVSVQQLEDQNKKLQVQASEAQVIDNFGDYFAGAGYVPVTKVEYIQQKHFSER